MRLIPEWRAVICRAYSVHLGAIAVVCELFNIVGNVWPLFAGLLPIPPLAFAILGLVFLLLGLIGRFIPQKSISGDKSNG